MQDRRHDNWRRAFNRYVPLAAAAVGVGLVLTAFFFLQDFIHWYAVVAVGLVVAVLGFLYGMNPFLTSERRQPDLRDEVESFISLVRQLSEVSHSLNGDMERIKSDMHESVERMASLAGNGR